MTRPTYETSWQQDCPACGQYVYRTHRCPGPRPLLPMPAGWRDHVRELCRQAAADETPDTIASAEPVLDFDLATGEVR